MQPDDDFPLNGLAAPVRTGPCKSMCLRRQRVNVCIELKNTSTYEPMVLIIRRFPLALDAIRLEIAFFNDRSGEFELFQARTLLKPSNTRPLSSRFILCSPVFQGTSRKALEHRNRQFILYI